MATEEEVRAARTRYTATEDEARDVLLYAIVQAARNAEHPPHLRDLAEAFAYVTNPNQPHGGSVNATR